MNSPATSAAKPTSDHPQPVDAPKNRMIERGDESTSSVVENQTMPQVDESTSSVVERQTMPQDDGSTSSAAVSQTILHDDPYCLPTYTEVHLPNFVWGELDGISFKCAIDAAYQEVVQW